MLSVRDPAANRGTYHVARLGSGRSATVSAAA